MPRFQGIPVEEKRGGRFGGVLVEDPPKKKYDPAENPLNATLGVLAKPLLSLAGQKRGIEDIFDAGAQLLVNSLPKPFVAEVNRALGPKLAPTAEQFNEGQATEEAQYQKERAAMGDAGVDLPRLGGNVVGTLPLAAALPAVPTTLLGTTATGVGTGLVTGALNPVVNDQEPFWKQKLRQAGVGAVTGGVVAPALQIAGRVAAPKVSDAVDFLMKRGVTMTPGQTMGKTTAKTEEALSSIPGFGDFIKNAQHRNIESFNIAAYNEVLAPIGEKVSVKAGHEGVKAVGDKLSKAYDDLVPELTLIPDQQFMTALDDAAAAAKLMSKDAAAQFESVVQNALPRGPLKGESLKALESKLTQEIARFGKSTDPSHQMAKEAFEDIRAAVLDNLARVNPTYAERLAAINSGWANLVRLERAAANTKDGIFTPEGLLTAAKAAESSVRKRATARGEGGPMQKLAKAGYETLGRAYPDSGSAGRIITSGAALGYLEPTALVAALAGAAPYTVLGQKIATAVLAKRPEIAQSVRKLLERSATPGGALVPLGVSGVLPKPPPNRRNNDNRRSR